MSKKIYFVGEGTVNGEKYNTDKFNQVIDPDTQEELFKDIYDITSCADFEKYEHKEDFMSVVIGMAYAALSLEGEVGNEIIVTAIDAQTDIFLWGVKLEIIDDDNFKYTTLDWKSKGIFIMQDNSTSMREVTVKEFAKVFEGVLAEVNTTDYFGITFEMSKARIEYSKDDGEVTFTTGNYNYDGVGSVIIEEEQIESIEYDEESEEYIVSFVNNIPDITVSIFKELNAK